MKYQSRGNETDSTCRSRHRNPHERTWHNGVRFVETNNGDGGGEGVISEVQEFTVTGNERERRFIEVIVKNARENKSRVKKKKREREKEWERGKSSGWEDEQDIVVRPLEIYKQYFSKRTGRIFIFIEGQTWPILMKYQVSSRRKWIFNEWNNDWKIICSFIIF